MLFNVLVVVVEYFPVVFLTVLFQCVEVVFLLLVTAA